MHFQNKVFPCTGQSRTFRGLNKQPAGTFSTNFCLSFVALQSYQVGISFKVFK